MCMKICKVEKKAFAFWPLGKITPVYEPSWIHFYLGGFYQLLKYVIYQLILLGYKWWDDSNNLVL